MKVHALTAVLRRYSNGARVKLFLDSFPSGLQEADLDSRALLEDLALLRKQLIQMERFKRLPEALGVLQSWVDLRITLEHIMSLCGRLSLPVSASVADWYGSMMLSAKAGAATNSYRINREPAALSLEELQRDPSRRIARLERRWNRVTNGATPKGRFNEWRFLSEAVRCLGDISRSVVVLLCWMMSTEFRRPSLQATRLTIHSLRTGS